MSIDISLIFKIQNDNNNNKCNKNKQEHTVISTASVCIFVYFTLCLVWFIVLNVLYCSSH